MPEDLVDNKSAFVQLMAGCREAARQPFRFFDLQYFGQGKK